jgi:hypothetical protein
MEQWARIHLTSSITMHRQCQSQEGRKPRKTKNCGIKAHSTRIKVTEMRSVAEGQKFGLSKSLRRTAELSLMWWAGSESNTRHKDFQSCQIVSAIGFNRCPSSTIKGFCPSQQSRSCSFSPIVTNRTVTLPPQRTTTARRIDNPLRSHFALIPLGLLRVCGCGVAEDGQHE